MLHAEHGAQVVAGALAVLKCAIHRRHEAGDHTILVGEAAGHPARSRCAGRARDLVLLRTSKRRLQARFHCLNHASPRT
ncbi:flavin reductase [Frankia sp. AiPs1]|uniref:flavin reductase n=1 Tax=Frankia sp. AiPs1 TaxID=573493 RepID=UPI0035AC02B3